MPLKYYKPQELIDLLLGEKPEFSPEKREEAEFVWREIETILNTAKENLPGVLAADDISNILVKYRYLAESMGYIRLSLKFFELCRIELGTEYYVKHSKISLRFYVFGRKFLVLAEELLKNVFGAFRSIEYATISRQNAQLSEFSYSRKVYLFNLIVKAVDQLFLFQRGTNFFVLNWELRLDIFFTCRGSLNYTDLLNKKITDRSFAEKEEILRILVISYEVLIVELKKEYEKTKQNFFFRNVLLLLEEFKKLNVLLGNKQKTQWIDRNLSSWKRMESYGKRA